MSTKPTATDLNIFKTISDFVLNLNNCFGKKRKSLQLYHRLISKFNFTDDDMIMTHIEIFRTFCSMNRDAISAKNSLEFTHPLIRFSDNIYINVPDIFNLATQEDPEITEIMWEYILTISALLDPENNTKELLKQQLAVVSNSESKQSDSSNNFLSSMIDMVGQQIDPQSTNPLEMVSSLLKSGAVNGIVDNLNSELTNGNINLGDLLGNMQGLVQNIQNEMKDSDDPLMKSMLSMLTSSMNQNGAGGTPP